MSPKKPLTLSTAKRKSRISAKLAKKSEIAAKKLDKDVAKLKAKEFRESEVQNSATPDIVATQSWRLPSHAATQQRSLLIPNNRQSKNRIRNRLRQILITVIQLHSLRVLIQKKPC
ncbi:hypothetical protein [Shewanella xiamenensis]|uniref:hypothetical protein n=1 Tax=Shewanella xiamenensis TaxID=332186 RepID=UPI0021BE55B1|nr:hypothetical protein [Shewanella xiamenensis]MCT8864358.1 hypothetical protein [Shewanella xiamenensis]